MATLGYSNQNGRGLSYSRLGTFHTCARKFEIENIIGYRPTNKNMTFAYGHFVGAGVQEYLSSRDLTKALFAGMMEYDLEDPWHVGMPNELRAKKSFFHAMDIVEKFATFIDTDFALKEQLKDLEVAMFEYQGKEIPAVELTFEIKIEGGWTYEGHIDIVLYNRKKNEYIIVELKTTGFTNLHPSIYQNSDQALGYAIVLDKIVEHKNAKSAFSVLYLVAKTSKKEFETFRFPKSIKARSQWINSLLLDIHHLETLEDAAKNGDMNYPKNGGSCYSFFRPCPYFNECDLSNSVFERRLSQDSKVDSFAEQEPVMFSFTMEEIIARQELLLKEKTPDAEFEEVELGNDGLEEFEVENW